MEEKINKTRWQIDRMNFRFPSGFEGRAGHISRQVGERLAQLPLKRSRELNTISIPRFTVDPGETDGGIAVKIADAIHKRLMNDI